MYWITSINQVCFISFVLFLLCCSLLVFVNGRVHLHNDLSVLRQDDVLQCVFHQQGEVHLIHSHVRQSRLLHREEEANKHVR